MGDRRAQPKQMYGADPSRLFVAGSSAGSNLAALCALTPNAPVFQPGFESADTSVTAAICLYGSTATTSAIRRTSRPDPAPGIHPPRCAAIPHRPRH
ncbi:alpha/beta hydrolase fold domain-containing protein [Streptomyces canus]|uniref:alpha/beta hydrolase fold domain-containing protein n=1 Tax=Streptomyces canus TaxID=58343 RepID=UPI0027D7B0D6|nr:alpha/beta hydrolase fold domain-containing protein [Streptomyces canus]